MAYKLNTNNDALRSVLETINTLPEAGSGEIPDGYEDVTAPLAELNAANGGTAATTMAGAVDNTEAHVSSQETLIAQIATALEGKAAGGGSGGSVETCTVRIVNNFDENVELFASVLDESGSFDTVYGRTCYFEDTLDIVGVVKYSPITLFTSGVFPTTMTITSGIVVYKRSSSFILLGCMDPSSHRDTITITIG